MRRLRRYLAISALAANCLGAGWRANAAEAGDVAEASRLYEAGAKAHGEGDYDTAARRFLEADEVVPARAALQAALAAALLAEDSTLAMRIAERAERASDDARAMSLAAAVRDKHAANVGRLAVRCDECQVQIDGERVAPGEAHWLETGEHEVVIDIRGQREERAVEVKAGATVELVPLRGQPPVAEPGPRPRPVPPPVESGATGISPAWFWVGSGLTAAAGIGAIISGLDTLQQHDDFQREPTRARSEDGQAAETRTNAFIGVTAGLGVTTALMGLFAVDWTDHDSTRAAGPSSVRWRVRPLGATVSGRF